MFYVDFLYVFRVWYLLSLLLFVPYLLKVADVTNSEQTPSLSY